MENLYPIKSRLTKLQEIKDVDIENLYPIKSRLTYVKVMIIGTIIFDFEFFFFRKIISSAREKGNIEYGRKHLFVGEMRTQSN